jgi:hypothetical protein
MSSPSTDAVFGPLLEVLGPERWRATEEREAFLHAMTTGNLAEFERLLPTRNPKIRYNIQRYRDVSALGLAASLNQTGMMKRLFESGMTLSGTSSETRLFLEQCLSHDNLAMLELLEQHGLDWTTIDRFWNPPIEKAPLLAGWWVDQGRDVYFGTLKIEGADLPDMTGQKMPGPSGTEMLIGKWMELAVFNFDATTVRHLEKALDRPDLPWWKNRQWKKVIENPTWEEHRLARLMSLGWNYEKDVENPDSPRKGLMRQIIERCPTEDCARFLMRSKPLLDEFVDHWTQAAGLGLDGFFHTVPGLMLLEEWGVEVDRKDEYGNTLLLDIVISRNLDIALLDWWDTHHPAAFEVANEKGQTPMTELSHLSKLGAAQATIILERRKLNSTLPGSSENTPSAPLRL